MIVGCPSCMNSLSIDLEQALELLGQEISCPDCSKIFSISQTKESLSFDLELESLKDEMVIRNSLKNHSRHFDDC